MRVKEAFFFLMKPLSFTFYLLILDCYSLSQENSQKINRNRLGNAILIDESRNHSLISVISMLTLLLPFSWPNEIRGFPRSISLSFLSREPKPWHDSKYADVMPFILLATFDLALYIYSLISFKRAFYGGHKTRAYFLRYFIENFLSWVFIQSDNGERIQKRQN